MRTAGLLLSIPLSLSMLACKPSSTPKPAPTTASTTPAASAEASTTAPITGPGFAASAFSDRVWRVQASSAVEPGTLYVFLSDGTLVITAAGSTPTLGQWRYEDAALTMVEEGQAYPTDIVALDRAHFTIRSHNPGTPVTITLERAAP